MPDFLLEIGFEEIPATMIDAASAELEKRVADLLKRESLEAGSVTRYDTPRRLAVLATGISSTQADITEKLTGPSVNMAYKDGQPTPAAQAFARKAGTRRIAAGKSHETQGGIHRGHRQLRPAARRLKSLAEMMPKEIDAIYWPKNMYWRTPGERLVRPVRWLVAMLDSEIIPLQFDGINAGRSSRGHRIIGDANASGNFRASEYASALRAGKVTRPRATSATNSQSTGCCHPRHSRSALEGGQSIAGLRGKSDGVADSNPGQFRPGISGSAARSPGYGNARPPKIFRC